MSRPTTYDASFFLSKIVGLSSGYYLLLNIRHLWFDLPFEVEYVTKGHFVLILEPLLEIFKFLLKPVHLYSLGYAIFLPPYIYIYMEVWMLDSKLLNQKGLRWETSRVSIVRRISQWLKLAMGKTWALRFWIFWMWDLETRNLSSWLAICIYPPFLLLHVQRPLIASNQLVVKLEWSLWRQFVCIQLPKSMYFIL